MRVRDVGSAFFSDSIVKHHFDVIARESGRSRCYGGRSGGEGWNILGRRDHARENPHVAIV